MSARRQRDRRRFRDVADVDARQAGAADRLRVDAVLQQHVLEPVVVLIEVVRTQDRERDAGHLERLLHADLRPEVREPRGLLGVVHRQVDDALDLREAHAGDRHQRLARLGLTDRVQQEDAVGAVEHAAHARRLEQVALHRRDPFCPASFAGSRVRTLTSARLLDQLLHHRRTHRPRSARYQDAHRCLHINPSRENPWLEGGRARARAGPPAAPRPHRSRCRPSRTPASVPASDP